MLKSAKDKLVMLKMASAYRGSKHSVDYVRQLAFHPSKKSINKHTHMDEEWVVAIIAVLRVTVQQTIKSLVISDKVESYRTEMEEELLEEIKHGIKWKDFEATSPKMEH